MKIFKILTLSVLVSCSFHGYSQAYWEIYDVTTVEVQNKMNSNKMEGINILTDINAHHTIGLSGISVDNKNTLENLFSENTLVVSYIISEDVTSIILDCNANLTLDQIKAILNEVNGNVTGHSVTYTVIQ